MTTRQDITPASMQQLRDRFHYSPAVRAGNMLYIAGQLGRDDDFQVIPHKAAQFAQAFENVKTILTEAGATFDDVVEMITYHTDMRDLELFITVKDRYITNLERLPAWTGVGVTSLSTPGLFVEIKCTAYLEA
jgi:enamine deaminase RidA (YjgF/YER057c/UK114 family)